MLFLSTPRGSSDTTVTSAAPPPAVIVLTTFSATADVGAFARALVEERLAACVNVLPLMTSTYRWKGAIESDREHQLIVKTSADRLEALKVRLQTLHPYDVPELLVLEAADGAEAYLDWLRESVRPPKGN
jgi:periplasmic divalent cation tolerance protein